jgi:hypothetical protein
MRNTIANADNFRTADYGQVGYLLAKGFPLSRVERGGEHVFFYFRSSAELLVALGDYASNALVPCRDFFHGLRRAKALIRENTYGSSKT